MPQTRRLFIYPKDISRIAGKGEAYGTRIIQLIRDTLGKKPHQNITVKEYADYEGVNVDEIQNLLI